MERIPLYYRLALLETLGISDEDLARWEDVSLRMYVPFHDGVISQFEGYENLRELDWERIASVMTTCSGSTASSRPRTTV